MKTVREQGLTFEMATQGAQLRYNSADKLAFKSYFLRPPKKKGRPKKRRRGRPAKAKEQPKKAKKSQMIAG